MFLPKAVTTCDIPRVPWPCKLGPALSVASCTPTTPCNLLLRPCWISHSHRLFPGHPDWNDAISLLAVTHRPSKEDHRLCPACLCETPASLSICVVCKGFLVSHGWRKRIKVTVATVPTAEPRPQEEDVKDHVKKAWEEVKIDLTGEEDDDEQMQDDDDVTMKSPEQEPQPEGENDDQASKKDDIDNERRDFREQDEVDEFLNEEREQAEENDEETEGGEINIEEYEAGEAHDAVVEYSGMVEEDRVWIKSPTNRALYNWRCSARAHQDPSVADWIAYPQNLQNLPTEFLWKL